MVRFLSALILSLAALAAPASAAVNGFSAADGDRACSPGEVDWDCLPAGVPVAEATDGTGAEDLGFTAGSKELQPGGWALGAGDVVGKSDLTRVWSAGEDTASNSFLYLAFETADSGGTAFISFELNQLGERENGLACRSDGDVLVAFETSGSNHDITPQVRIWAGDNDGGCAQTGTWNGPAAGAPAATAEGRMSERFGEVALDLGSVARHIGTAKPCEVFRSVYTHTRASDSINADMKDHVEGQTIGVAACAPPDGGGGGGGGDADTDPPSQPTLDAAASCDQDGAFNVTGTAQPGSQVLIYADGHAVASGVAGVNGSYTIAITQDASATHSYTARAFDEDGGSSSSFPVSVSAGPAPAAPSVTSHPDGAVVATGTLTLSGTAAPGATVRVSTPGGTLLETTTASPSGTWSVQLSGVEAGVLRFRISASSACGQSDDTALMLVAVADGGTGGGTGGDPDTDAPATPTLSGPSGCDQDGVVTLTGTAQPGSEVVISDADGPVATGHAGDDGSFSIDVTAGDGTRSYTATAHDEDGGSAPSPAVSVDVDATPPALTVNAAGAPGKATLSGTSDPGATITVREGGVVVATTTAGSDGKWSATVGAPAGDHSYVVRAQDACGNAQGAGDIDGDGKDGVKVVVTSPDSGGGGTGGGTPEAEEPGTGPDTGGVAGECATKPFRVLISKSEKRVKRVTFLVDGRKVKTVRKRDRKGRFTTMIDPAKYKPGTHQVTAKLRLRGGKKRTVKHRVFQVCGVGKCTSRMKFWMPIRRVSGDPYVSAKATVAGKKAKVTSRKGRLGVQVNLIGKPKGAYKVRVLARTESGRTVKRVRKIRTCGLKKPQS